MKKGLAAIFLTLMVGSCCQAVLAEDAVSSATVDITSVPAIQESDEATTLVIYLSTNDTVKAVALNGQYLHWKKLRSKKLKKDA